MNIRPLCAVVLRETLILRGQAAKYLLSMCVAPLLYMISFGWAFRDRLCVDGMPYLSFMVPGLVAMTCMRQSFGISTEINIARFYWRIFDELRSSPLSDMAYTAGEVINGTFRGVLAGGVVLALAALFGTRMAVTPLFLVSLLLHASLFSSLAVITAMLVRTHAEQGMLNNFLITPMSFLCGTFFPVGQYPAWVQKVIYALPLTHASRCMRAALLGSEFPWWSLAFMAAAALALFLTAAGVIRMSRN